MISDMWHFTACSFCSHSWQMGPSPHFPEQPCSIACCTMGSWWLPCPRSQSTTMRRALGIWTVSHPSRKQVMGKSLILRGTSLWAPKAAQESRAPEECQHHWGLPQSGAPWGQGAGVPEQVWVPEGDAVKRALVVITMVSVFPLSDEKTAQRR